MRIASYNARHAQGVASPPWIARTARVLGALGADIIGVNELYRMPGVFDQAASLGRALDMHVEFHACMRHGPLEYGNALLSREPLRSAERIELPKRWERRGLLLATTAVKGTDVRVGVTHLSLHPDTRLRQAEVITALATACQTPFLLCGDLNSEIEKLGTLAVSLGHAEVPPPTYHALRPTIAYDHVLWSAHWSDAAVGTVRSLASDHIPVYADLELLPRSTASIT